MIWSSPVYLGLLISVPILIIVFFFITKKRRTASLTFSETVSLNKLPGNWRAKASWLTKAFYLVSITLIIVAMARPQSLNETIERTVEGIDIVIVFDISSSMLAEDLRPNRLIAAKNLTASFLDNRKNDRIGLVIFARESFTLVPPTTDYRLVRSQLMAVDIGMTRDGTAIGMGVATGVNRLRNSTAESRVIILLTDGENNAGEIDPLTAADLAAAHGIRMYTIGVSTEGTAPYPIDDPIFGRRYHQIQVDIDEPMLTEMARRTGGRYFRARDNDSLQQIYTEIDRMETSAVDETIYIDRLDLYQKLLLPGILILLFGMVCDRFIFRSELS
jgi:Ca-activated chloride channel family protein